MSSQDEFDPESTRTTQRAPYTAKHPIPTIQKYRAERSELKDQQEDAEQAQQDEADDSTVKRAYHAAKGVLKGEDPPSTGHEPYKTQNRNVDNAEEPNGEGSREPDDDDKDGQQQTGQENAAQDHSKQGQSATEAAAGHSDPRQKRKEMKHNKRDKGGREVTDPVTHLPIVIRDSTNKDLHSVGENLVTYGSTSRTSTGIGGANKSQDDLDTEKDELQRSHDGMQKLFPPPRFEELKNELARIYAVATTAMLGSMAVLVSIVGAVAFVFDFGALKRSGWMLGISAFTFLGFTIGLGGLVVYLVQGWLGQKVKEIWDDEVWDTARQEELRANDSKDIVPESVAWLNNLLASVWPLINPDLFTSMSDMLEDVMQASLPKVVRMVSVDDLGQGSEAVRILGINWLPTGAASQTVGTDGKLEGDQDGKKSDRSAPGEGHIEGGAPSTKDGDQSDGDKPDNKQKEEDQQAIREGMEAEQGDFVNMELAFAYRARASGKSLQAKAKNAHLYLKFYLPGGIAVPVWVEMRGIVGTMRLRLQLTPDPPFLSLCTLSFMGQPMADLSCVPLSRHALNLMDVPLISSFVQSSIDAALAEYVAPKSLTLDLKDMLVGDDFKKDTVSRGVVMIFIKSAKGFKEGDGGIGPFEGSSDSYVTVSWGKFGKPVASTRIIVEDQSPSWHEWSHILVTPEELNAGEKLRLQLWDSDKYTADDDLGRVEVDLRELMHSPRTHNKMCDREDRFMGDDDEEQMPGSLQWRVGYFAKVKITEEQLAKQTADKNIRSEADLKNEVSETAERKLREATAHDEGKEVKQQKQQDYKEREDDLVISSPPPDDYPSGMLSIQIHNITGLETQSLNKKDKKSDKQGREDEAEQNDDLPSSYATVILNHQKIYRTRTKPKNAKPFFNAGTERFIADWKNAEVMISVRDDREREDDALLGMIYLPLRTVFSKASQVMQTYPLIGGMGYGRARISMVWRSVELKLPTELLGWNYGTLEVQSPVRLKNSNHQGSSFDQHRLKLRTTIMRAKMHSSGSDQGTEWTPKSGNKSIFLAVQKRYSSPLIIEFRKSSLGPDSTVAFGVFWLKDIPDDEQKTITVQIWKGGKKNAHRATTSYGYEGMDEGEQPLGEIELDVKFWRGLSGYHKGWANKAKNTNMRDVMEVLDTANDEGQMEESDGGDDNEDGESDSDSDNSTDSEDDSADNDANPSKKSKMHRKLRTHTNDSSSDSDSDAKSEHNKPASLAGKPIGAVKSLASNLLDVNGHNDPDSGDRGVRAQVRDYKDHHRQLHRKHRGVMQWKGARTASWVSGKAKRLQGAVEAKFHHNDEAKAGGVETEV